MYASAAHEDRTAPAPATRNRSPRRRVGGGTLAVYLQGGALALLTFGLAFLMRMLEWPLWQDPEFRLGQEMMLATHDAYHWVAGAEGFSFGTGHPMSLLLAYLSTALGSTPAAVAFWFPLVLSSLLAVIVYAWAWVMGSMELGVAAGVLTSLAPGFLARTMLGYYDTDLVTIFFPLLITLGPACWIMRFLLLPQMVLRQVALGSGRKMASRLLRRAKGAREPLEGNPLRWQWVLLLGIAGQLAWWTQSWHAMFPYLIRYNICLLVLLTVLMAPSGRRGRLLLGALAYAAPTLLGYGGLLVLPVLLLAGSGRFPALYRFLRRRPVLFLGWLGLLICLVQSDIFQSLWSHLGAYVKRSAEVMEGQPATSLIYPSVAQSILEVQDLDFRELLAYFHPWEEVALLGLLGFCWVLYRRPAALFLLPLAALGLLSLKLGGRMVMFGAPVVALGLTLPLDWLRRRFLRPGLRNVWTGLLCSGVLLSVLASPFLELIPAMSQGPMINRRHAEALLRAQSITPEDAMLWLWWDWGYAAHHFARRNVIADGASHGGPYLYLPAAVFATDSPRFARQIIKHTALRGNNAANVFEDMRGEQANALMRRLADPATPLIEADGKQYLVVSFEMLRLGFWLKLFGSWDFVTQEGHAAALSIVPQELAYRLDTGEVQANGNAASIFASGMAVFEDGRLTSRNYIQEWFDAHPDASPEEQQNFLAGRRNVYFLLNHVTNEKLVMDENIYRSLMVRLLIAPPGDPELAPYFRLVYDNIFVRIYEVL